VTNTDGAGSELLRDRWEAGRIPGGQCSLGVDTGKGRAAGRHRGGALSMSATVRAVRVVALGLSPEPAGEGPRGPTRSRYRRDESAREASWVMRQCAAPVRQSSLSRSEAARVHAAPDAGSASTDRPQKYRTAPRMGAATLQGSPVAARSTRRSSMLRAGRFASPAGAIGTRSSPTAATYTPGCATGGTSRRAHPSRLRRNSSDAVSSARGDDGGSDGGGTDPGDTNSRPSTGSANPTGCSRRSSPCYGTGSATCAVAPSMPTHPWAIRSR